MSSGTPRVQSTGDFRRRKITKLSAEAEEKVLATARELRCVGTSWETIRDRLGIGVEWLKRRIVPGYALKAVARRRDLFQASIGRVETKLERQARHPVYPPHDTRDFTARMFGDPIPERSALAKRSA